MPSEDGGRGGEKKRKEEKLGSLWEYFDFVTVSFFKEIPDSVSTLLLGPSLFLISVEFKTRPVMLSVLSLPFL